MASKRPKFEQPCLPRAAPGISSRGDRLPLGRLSLGQGRGSQCKCARNRGDACSFHLQILVLTAAMGWGQSLDSNRLLLSPHSSQPWLGPHQLISGCLQKGPHEHLPASLLRPACTHHRWEKMGGLVTFEQILIPSRLPRYGTFLSLRKQVASVILSMVLGKNIKLCVPISQKRDYSWGRREPCLQAVLAFEVSAGA